MSFNARQCTGKPSPYSIRCSTCVDLCECRNPYFVRASGKKIVRAFHALTTSAQSGTSSAEQSSRPASTVATSTTLTATHQFLPPTLLAPRITMLPVLSIDPYAQYIETVMFQLAEQQSITNWAGTVTQQTQYADYRSRVQLCNTTS